MKKALFENLFDFLPKSKRQAGVGLAQGVYPFYKSSNELTMFLDAFDYPGNCLIFGTGGRPSVHYQAGKFSTSTDCIVACPKDNTTVNAKYTYLYFKSNMRILEAGFQGSGLKHISKGYISKIKIPLPALDDQIRIANILTLVEKLIAKRKKSINVLDDLLKSNFLEMFGPSNKDFLSWPIVMIKDLAANHKGAMRTGPFGSSLLHSEFSATGDVAVLGIDNAVQNKFAWGEKRFITKARYSELSSFRIFPGDVIITIMGTIGRAAVIPDDIPLAINTKHLAAITFDRQKANPKFIAYSFHASPYIKNQIACKNRGTIMNGLNLGLIKETKLSLPPIELQNQFAAIVEKVESLKSKYTASLTELENLYGSLSQRAFKGELDLCRAPKKIDVKPEPIIANANITLPSLKVESKASVKNFFSQNDLIAHLKTQKGQVFCFEELWLDLESLSANMIIDKKEIQKLMLNLLDADDPIVEQVFASLTSTLKNDKNPPKQIAFKVNDENQKV